MPDYIGQHFGNYRLLRLLGEGGFAQVYLGEHIYLKTTAAIKVLLANLQHNDSQAFLNEARTVARLRHPHIVRVLEFGVTPEAVAFLAMGYAPDGTLRQRHGKHTVVPLEKIVIYVNQVASALHFAHEQKLIHRDVKPENMLLGRGGEVLLSDFGIAIAARNTLSQDKAGISGTVIYMAPEQLQGRPRPASDQYSLGIVVYEWLAGEPPFRGANFLATAYLHLQSPPPSLQDKVPGLFPEVEAVVMRVLAKDPVDRFPSTLAFAQALEKACERKISASFPTLPLPPRENDTQSDPLVKQHPERFTRRTLAVALGTALGLSLTGGGFVWYTRTQGHAGPQASLTPTPTMQPLPSRPVGTTLAAYSQHTQAVTGVAWSPTGNWIASSSDDKTVQVWSPLDNTASHRFVYTKHTDKIVAVAWSPKGKYIASASADQTVQVWNAPYLGSGTPGATIFVHPGNAGSLAWSPDGQRIASTTIQGLVMQVWDAESGKHAVYYFDATQSGPETVPGPVSPVAWSPNGQEIVAYLVHASVWSVASSSSLLTYNIPDFLPIHGLAWSPGSTRIALASEDGMVQIWDTTTGNTPITYKGHTGPVYAVSWSHDGKYLVSAGHDKTVQVWGATDGKSLFTYGGHTAAVNAVAWASDSRHVVSGGDDKKVLVWQAV